MAVRVRGGLIYLTILNAFSRDRLHRVGEDDMLLQLDTFLERLLGVVGLDANGSLIDDSTGVYFSLHEEGMIYWRRK